MMNEKSQTNALYAIADALARIANALEENNKKSLKPTFQELLSKINRTPTPNK